MKSLVILVLLTVPAYAQDPFDQQIDAQKTAEEAAKKKQQEDLAKNKLAHSLVPPKALAEKMAVRDWHDGRGQLTANGKLARVYYRNEIKNWSSIEVKDPNGNIQELTLLGGDDRKYVDAFVNWMQLHKDESTDNKIAPTKLPKLKDPKARTSDDLRAILGPGVRNHRTYTVKELKTKFGDPSKREINHEIERWTFTCTDRDVVVGFRHRGYASADSAADNLRLAEEFVSDYSDSKPVRGVRR